MKSRSADMWQSRLEKDSLLYCCSRAAGQMSLGMIPMEADKESATQTGNKGYKVNKNSAPDPHGYLSRGRLDNSPLRMALVTGVRSEG